MALEAPSTAGTIKIDPRDIEFTQSCIIDTFHDGHSLESTIKGLRDGTVKLGSNIPSIRIVRLPNGKLVSLDNRRLYCLKQLVKGKHGKVTVEVELLDYNDQAVQDELYGNEDTGKPAKLTTKDGTDIRVKPTDKTKRLKNWVPRKGERGGHFIYDKDHRKVYYSQLSKKQKDAIIAKDPTMREVYDALDDEVAAQAEVAAWAWAELAKIEAMLAKIEAKLKAKAKREAQQRSEAQARRKAPCGTGAA